MHILYGLHVKPLFYIFQFQYATSANDKLSHKTCHTQLCLKIHPSPMAAPVCSHLPPPTPIVPTFYQVCAQSQYPKLIRFDSQPY